MRWSWRRKPAPVKWKKVRARDVKPGDVVRVFDTFVRTVLHVHIGERGPTDRNGSQGMGRRAINFEFPNDPDWWHINRLDYLVSVRCR